VIKIEPVILQFQSILMLQCGSANFAGTNSTRADCNFSVVIPFKIVYEEKNGVNSIAALNKNGFSLMGCQLTNL